ncbi:riboflavin synthase [Deferribacterales bacterium Es71-Z0220]|jgi:riboflavin synthase|uniref:riboflavin synthase n=1 Tax=Deferrivibrio essentukiensis TaxID=2880922 RepID=UPI001F60ADEA|nr:riboflavin synthase [Deferrivibrio essentukiensis]MBZ4671937.1 riboflavin synthase [Deferribacteraceae bacterium]MCB4204192.1 riboflavin synthase [Deferrivibrio essentukiensis]
MFTGIIEELGKIKNLSVKGRDAVICIEALKVIEGTKIGDSIAVNGVCLTVVKMDKNMFWADLSFETLNKSSLQNLKPSNFVNLERALTLSTRLGGHIVSGHVDCVGKIAGIDRKGDSYELKVSYSKEVDKFIALKGSVTLDGISLTVSNIKNNVLSVAVIPHTFENTNLKFKRVGDLINLEVDVIARYLEKLMNKSDYNSNLKDGLFGLNLD